MNEQRKCLHAYVSGRVQGVWFRAFVREEALKLDLHGWAKNLEDGRVEVMLCGAENTVEDCLDKLREGPRLARVTHIQTQSLCWEIHDDFQIY
jgi:acylphosphatase